MKKNIYMRWKKCIKNYQLIRFLKKKVRVQRCTHTKISIFIMLDVAMDCP